MSDLRLPSTLSTRVSPTLAPTAATGVKPAAAKSSIADTSVATGGKANVPVATQLVAALFQKAPHAVLDGIITNAIRAGQTTRHEAPGEVFSARMSLARYGLSLVSAGTHGLGEIRGLDIALEYGAVSPIQLDAAAREGTENRLDAHAEDTHAMQHLTDWTAIGSERAWLMNDTPRTSIVALHTAGHGGVPHELEARMKFEKDLKQARSIIAAVESHEPVSPNEALAFLVRYHGIEATDVERIHQQAEANFRNDDPHAWTRTPG